MRNTTLSPNVTSRWTICKPCITVQQRGRYLGPHSNRVHTSGGNAHGKAVAAPLQHKPKGREGVGSIALQGLDKADMVVLGIQPDKPN